MINEYPGVYNLITNGYEESTFYEGIKKKTLVGIT